MPTYLNTNLNHDLNTDRLNDKIQQISRDQEIQQKQTSCLFFLDHYQKCPVCQLLFSLRKPQDNYSTYQPVLEDSKLNKTQEAEWIVINPIYLIVVSGLLFILIVVFILVLLFKK